MTLHTANTAPDPDVVLNVYTTAIVRWPVPEARTGVLYEVCDMKRGYVLWGAIGGIVFFSLLNLMPLFGTNNSAETAQIYGSVFSALHIIQYSDEAYSTKMDHYTQSIRNLASCHLSYGYTFIPDNGRDFGRAEGMCMYTSKVAVIRQALYEHDIGDWILWVDLDV